MTGKTALVTGGAGFIGSHLVDRLVRDGMNVAVIDNFSTGKRSNLGSDATLYDVDICDENLLGVIEEISPDIVYHLAAQISVSVSTREPVEDARVNVMGFLNLLEALRATTLPRFIFSSTGGAIYGEPDRNPVSETDPCRPESPYAASKLAAEGYLGTYKAAYGLDYSIVRLGNVYGPRQEPHGEAGVIAIFARAMLARDQVKIFGDGEDERDYVYVSDIVEGFLKAAEKGGSTVYNLGSGIGTNVNELASRLIALTETSVSPEYGAPRAGDIHKVSLNAEKAREQLGWEVTVGLDEGLKSTVEFFQDEANR
ncbi:MAG: GDP-mannose 4,6-dehydratase [Chloroflexi bacterium]|nr:GDP-mannose 4,6-dehydratase [Chloroflexota bacterium]